ncbi:hypothetical protein NGC65_10660 [Staphylococcus xylosus]|uniref:hypothetical protein n=1 Tax=Staphylococcus xylosus TaxID=1288 RepID=UPI002DBC9252|nr:hypothetical protein [Staphylococcus xylosus]MEB6290882.1 hypothetical protein [Staphylococcus xylosus]MEB7720146.1 hypothetical protein [Staphylococcus xylosus]MEB7814935.1 hypothetical protein [Staphylococcus xylosus]MEB7822883.1 hypothetical protein [Staphylococcus xylosus]MEB7837942.1 hypothetical protein [Staphylococcus xylosus]
MKFINLSAVTEKGLNKKVNAFLEENPYIEIIKFDYAIGSSSYGVGILYQDKVKM